MSHALTTFLQYFKLKVVPGLTYCTYITSVLQYITLATVVIGISNWFLFVHLVKCCYTCHIYSEQREWDGWAHMPRLTHLSLVRTTGFSVVLWMLYQQLIVHLLIVLIGILLACWFYFTLFSDVLKKKNIFL